MNNGISGWLDSPASVAAARGVIGAVLIATAQWAGGNTIGLNLTDEQEVKAFIFTLVTVLIWRFGFEGLYDQHRSTNGNVKPGDVGAYLPPLKNEGDK